MSLNRILLIGNLTQDVEPRYLPSGKPVSYFRIATNRRFKVECEVREEVEFFNIVAYGRLGEIASEFLTKGKSVFIEGRLRTRSWTDTNGSKHYRTEVIAEAMTLIGSKSAPRDECESQEVFGLALPSHDETE